MYFQVIKVFNPCQLFYILKDSIILQTGFGTPLLAFSEINLNTNHMNIQDAFNKGRSSD
jgi:hypothetical protein